jgi:hypothetical protein
VKDLVDVVAAHRAGASANFPWKNGMVFVSLKDALGGRRNPVAGHPDCHHEDHEPGCTDVAGVHHPFEGGLAHQRLHLAGGDQLGHAAIELRVDRALAAQRANHARPTNLDRHVSAIDRGDAQLGRQLLDDAGEGHADLVKALRRRHRERHDVDEDGDDRDVGFGSHVRQRHGEGVVDRELVREREVDAVPKTDVDDRRRRLLLPAFGCGRGVGTR